MEQLVEYYMSLPYELQVTKDVSYDGSIYYVATYKELGGGLSGTGDTETQAINNLKDFEESWFFHMLEIGLPIPEP